MITITIAGTPIQVPNTNENKEVIVDSEDYNELIKYKWFYNKKSKYHGYIAAIINGKRVYLHNFLMKPSIGYVVDHINGNILDNRRCNLRICTQKENIKNQKIRRNNTSGYKGVHFNKKLKKWCARYSLNNKRKHIGYYNTPKEAAIAYNEKTLEHYGEFARLNIIK